MVVNFAVRVVIWKCVFLCEPADGRIWRCFAYFVFVGFRTVNIVLVP